MKVLKWPIPTGENPADGVFVSTLTVRARSVVKVDVDFQDKACLWTITDDTDKEEKIEVWTVGTGRELNDPRLIYVGTFKDDPYFWHVFYKRIS